MLFVEDSNMAPAPYPPDADRIYVLCIDKFVRPSSTICVVPAAPTKASDTCFCGGAAWYKVYNFDGLEIVLTCLLTLDKDGVTNRVWRLFRVVVSANGI